MIRRVEIFETKPQYLSYGLGLVYIERTKDYSIL